ncbi:MAG: FG-GAP repeat domain-containing protein [Acidimicrobiia bacterium]
MKAPRHRNPSSPVAVLVTVIVALAGCVATGIAAAPPAGAASVTLTKVGQGEATYNSYTPGIGPIAPFSSPAVADITGDGVPEVVVGGMDGCTRVYSLSGASKVGCLWDGGGAVQSSPTLVDWDGDGVKDVIVTSVLGGIYAWRGNGNPLFSWGTAGGVFASPAVGDIDGDGRPDIAIATWGQRVTAYRHDGSTMFSNFIFDTSWSTPALADLDGDGTLEVIVGADMDRGNGANFPPYNMPPGGYVWVFHRDGSNLAGFPRHLSDQVVWSSPSVVDLNRDGHLDIVVGTGLNWAGIGHQLFAIDRFGNALPGWPVSMTDATMASPAIADLDGDGRWDVAEQTADGRITYVGSDGATWQGPKCNMSFTPCQPLGLGGGVAVGDVNGDGVQDVVSFTEANLRVYSGQSLNLPEADVAMPYTWAPSSTPTIVNYGGNTYVVVTASIDADHNGQLGVGDHQLTSIFRAGNGSGVLTWPMFHGNLRHTGTFSDEVPPTINGSFSSPDGSTKLRADWSGRDSETGVAGFDVDVRQDSQSWVRLVSHGGGRAGPGSTASGGQNVYAIPGHGYQVRARSWDVAGNVSSWSSLGTVSVSSGAVRVQPFRAAYAGSLYGSVSSVSSPPADSPAFGLPLVRGIAARAGGGGYELDAFGGIHEFGGAPVLTGGGYWPGWDITRGIALDPSGRGGLVLDGYGGVHPFGASRAPRSGLPYWPGHDVARGIVLTADSTLSAPKGYILDAYGGVFAFGGAPSPGATAYWPGWEIVRGIALDPAGRGGYTIDAFGGLHAFGGAPVRTIRGYWPGRDVTRGVALIGGGARGRGYVLDAAGGIWPFGGAPAVEVTNYWGVLVGRGLSIAP